MVAERRHSPASHLTQCRRMRQVASIGPVRYADAEPPVGATEEVVEGDLQPCLRLEEDQHTHGRQVNHPLITWHLHFCYACDTIAAATDCTDCQKEKEECS